MKHPFSLVLFFVAAVAFGAPDPAAKPSAKPPAATPSKPVAPAKPAPKPVPAKPATVKPTPAPAPVPEKTVLVPVVKPSNVLIEGGVGTSLGALSVTGRMGGEYVLGLFKLADLPFAYGVAGHLNAGYFQAERSAYRVSDSGWGLAGLGTLHFGWSALFPTLPVVKDLDTSLAIGLGFYTVGRSFLYTDGRVVSGGSLSGLGLSTQVASQWFVVPSIAFRLEFGYYGCYSALGVGAVYKF